MALSEEREQGWGVARRAFAHRKQWKYLRENVESISKRLQNQAEDPRLL